MTIVGVKWPWNIRPEWEVDIALIEEAIRDILLTTKGERKMNPNYGSELLGIIFENKGQVLDTLARREISLALSSQLPMITVENIDIIYPSDDNEPIDIVIYYIYLGESHDTTVSTEGQ